MTDIPSILARDAELREKATELPWEVGQFGAVLGKEDTRMFIVRDGDDGNLDFLVHRVNTYDALVGEIELLANGCEQALLLLERKRFKDDGEAGIVRAVLLAALHARLALGDSA